MTGKTLMLFANPSDVENMPQLWFLTCVALCASCQKLVEGQRLFRDMMALRGQIAAQLHKSRVQVNVIGKGTVAVTSINSPLNSASTEEK